MISFIKGTLEDVQENYIVVDCQGIGYQIFISGRFLGELPGIGDSVKVHTYMNIREDEISLYGFSSKNELKVFKILLGISGVGPKVALSVLTALSVEELHLAVVSGDVKAITKANGIGTKGAQRIILELKDKLDISDMLDAAYEESRNSKALSGADVTGDVMLALTSLGYSNSDALLAIRKVEHSSEMNTEQLLKAALKKII